jgi:diguanylate cyclase (GGDEF)-like protein
MDTTDRIFFDHAIFAERSDVLGIVLDHIPQGVVVVDRDYRVLAFNRPVVELFLLPTGTFAVGCDFREVIGTWARETGQDEAMRERALAELDLQRHFEFQFPQRVAGETRWMVLTHDPLPDGGFVRTFTDITIQKRLEEKLLEMSRTDPLTGLLNHQAFYETVSVEIERKSRYRRPLTLMYLDIDHFKEINDRFGHPAGDRVLWSFARILAQSTRKGDAIGRVGGEEFAVLLPEAAMLAGVEAAARILDAVRGMSVLIPGRHDAITFTVSAGLAESDASMTVDQLVSAADAALYQAKSDGRNCFRSTC